MDLTMYDGKTLALLLCGEAADGADDWAVFPGVARLRGTSLYLERSGGRPDVEILPEWHERICRSDDKVRPILQGAEYFVALSVGNLQDGEGKDYVPTGLKWPK